MLIVIVNRYYVGAQMYSIFVDYHKNLSDDVILKKIQEGSVEYLSSLFARYINLVHNKVTRYSVSELEIEDFIQEGLIALYHAAKTFNFSSSSFKTYANTCVTNAIVTLLKQKNHII